ncbi:MAG: acyl carrier protein [bacterium]|jgi:acyl carrier protein
MNIEERVKQILAKILNADPSKIDRHFSAEFVKEWDSLQQMNIIVALEEEFGIRFGEAESILLKNYSSLQAAVKKKLDD